MEEHHNGWLRVRGIGRERLARYVTEFLSGAGYRVEERTEPMGAQPSSLVLADLARPNPAVPASFAHLEFRSSPTAGGSMLRWELPTSIANESERSRALRFATELSSSIEQKVALESRSAGRVTKDHPLPPPLMPAGPTSEGASSGPGGAPAASPGRTGGGRAAPAEGRVAPSTDVENSSTPS